MRNQQNLSLWLLEQLAIYRFLCPSQFEMLGVNISKNTLYSELKSLRQRGFTNIQSYNCFKKGRVEDVHYLLPKAKNYLLKRSSLVEKEFKISGSKLNPVKHYVHRKMTITTNIKIREYCISNQINLEQYLTYFETKSSNTTKRKVIATKIGGNHQSIIADAVFIVNQNNKKKLFYLEIHNGYRLKKIVQQLKPYGYALASGSLSKTFNISSNAHILVLFEKPSTMDSCMEAMWCDPFYTNLKPYFMFSTYEDFLINPNTCWINLYKNGTTIC